MSDNDIILLGNVLARFLSGGEYASLIGPGEKTLVIDGMVDVTEQEKAVVRRVGGWD